MHLQLLTGCIKYLLRSQKNTYTCYDVLIDLFTLNKCSRCIEQVFPWIVSVYEKWAQAYKKNFFKYLFIYIYFRVYLLFAIFFRVLHSYIYLFFFKLIQTYSFVKRQSNPNLVCRFEAVWTATQGYVQIHIYKARRIYWVYWVYKYVCSSPYDYSENVNKYRPCAACGRRVRRFEFWQRLLRGNLWDHVCIFDCPR